MVSLNTEDPSMKKKEENVKKKVDDKKSSNEDLSEEDALLKDQLDMLVKRLGENDVSLYKPSLEAIRSSIRSATTSMTSVPKPLKFLRPHYTTLKSHFATLNPKTPKDSRELFADVISVLAMTSVSAPVVPLKSTEVSEESSEETSTHIAEDKVTVSAAGAPHEDVKMDESADVKEVIAAPADENKRDCLKFRLLGSGEDIGAWGHEYVHHISGEVGAEYQNPILDGVVPEQLTSLASLIVPFCMKHNAEAAACDLVMEVECLDLLSEHIDKETYRRVCLYLLGCVRYVAEPEDDRLLRTALDLYQRFHQYPDALRVALMLNDMSIVQQLFESCSGDPLMQKQLAYMCGRQQTQLQLDDDELADLLSNVRLSEGFLQLARELDIMEPKTPEDIYKSHLEATRLSFGTSIDSAQQNLASTFVNAFVNAGFGNDKLMIGDEGSKWIFKNKEHRMISAAASLGLIMLWDVPGGLSQIDKYLYHNDDNIKAGALMACGVVNSGIRDECDSAMGLLSEMPASTSNAVRVGSLLGLGLAYAGSARADVVEVITPILENQDTSAEAMGVAALALGLVCVGTGDVDATSSLLEAMMERPTPQLKSTHANYLALGIGLILLGKQQSVETTLDAIKAIETQPLGKVAAVLVEACAYAGTGNVLKVQELLHLCSEHFDSEKDEHDSHQAVAVIGIGLVAMGEDLGADMALRATNHLLQYGELTIRRAVPLCIALISTSFPQLGVLDMLSKLSHDADADVAINSILAMGIVGAGTNNARLAGMLRQLASYYHQNANALFMVRIAQGLLYMGKGTMTLSPFHSDRSLMSPVAVAGLLGVLVTCLDVQNTICDKAHYMLYCFVPAMHARMLVTLDEDLAPLPVSVRVGQAVDVVGHAGHPKSITGFQTHTTPVLLSYNERAELATEEYLPVSRTLEHFIILRKNPDWEAVEDESKDKKDDTNASTK